MDPITEKAWEVFRSAFKDGESVIVERSDGMFFWGTLKAEDEQIRLTRPEGIERIVSWDDIEFMAHDGFPVSRLMGMTQEEANTRAHDSPNQIIRETLDDTITKRDDERAYGGGCPFVAEPCRLVGIHNKGNTGRRFWYNDAEEVLVFRSADGAIMHSYDTDHLFLLP